jgi:hypothetical protein
LCFNPRPQRAEYGRPARGFHFSTETTEDTVKHHLARGAALLMAAAAIGIAGCGDDDKDGTAATATQTQATATATATATDTATDTTATTTTRPAGQREAVVPGEKAELRTGDEIGLSVKVDRVYDPVAAAVDRAQPGNKLIGIVLTGQSKSAIEPTRTTAYTSLKTTDGTIKGTRIIADGDCGGGFTAAELLLAVDKPETGCIGFEIPKNATPESLTIVLTSPDGTEQATWKLPKAK